MKVKPRTEQEIIPPTRIERRRRAGTARIHVFADHHGVRHVYVARLGPLGVLLLVLIIANLSAIILVLLVGAFLIWIPLVGLLIAAVIILGLLRRYFHRAS